MTEYDYSPEAYERYLSTQHRISNWITTTEYHRDEFEDSVPVTPPGKSSRKDPLYHHPIYHYRPPSPSLSSSSGSSDSSSFSYVFLHNSAQVPARPVAPSPRPPPQPSTSWYRPKPQQPWGYPAQALLGPSPYSSPALSPPALAPSPAIYAQRLERRDSARRTENYHTSTRPRSTSPPKPRLSIRTASHNDQRHTSSLPRDANSYFQTVHHPQYRQYQQYQQPMLAPQPPPAFHYHQVADSMQLARTRTIHRSTRR